MRMFPKLERKSTPVESETDYFKKFDQELGMALELSFNYLKKEGKEKKLEHISQEWLQELADWRADNGINPLQNIEQDVADLKMILSAKAENDLLSEKATADSCYYDHLLLLSLGTSELNKKPELQYKNDEDLDLSDLIDVYLNNSRKATYYNEAKSYLKNESAYNHNTSPSRYTLMKKELDSEAILVLDKLGVMAQFYQTRDYYHFSSLPTFVADKMIENGQQEDLYYSAIYPKFESLSKRVAEDMINFGRAQVISYLEKDFSRFKGVESLWAWEKILKCSHSYNFPTSNFINTHFKDAAELEQVYLSSLSRNLVKDEDISPNLSDEARQQYIKQRDELSVEIKLAVGPLIDYRNEREAHPDLDAEKIYILLDNGYGPLVLKDLSKRDLTDRLDLEIIFEKLQKHKQSYYVLHNSYLADEISGDIIAKRIISEGDIDILAANLDRLILTEDLFIKLSDGLYAEAVAKNLNRFNDLSDQALNSLIAHDNDYLVVRKLSHFNISQTALKGLIDRNLNLFVESVSLTYLEAQGVLPYFLKIIDQDAKALTKTRSNGFKELTLENQNKFAQQVSQTSAMSDFLIFAAASKILANLDFNISAEQLDAILEEEIGANYVRLILSDLQHKPSDSFYVQQIHIFTDESNREKIDHFIRLIKKGILSRSLVDYNLLFAALDELGNLAKVKDNLNLYLKNTKEKSQLERELYLKMIKTDASNLAKNEPSQLSGADYELALRFVYPQRDNNNYEVLDQYQDKTADLDKLKFDRAGYTFVLDGISGYQLKAGEEVKQSVIDEYSLRMTEIKNLANPEALLQFLDQELVPSDLSTLEAKLIDYLNKVGYNRDSVKVILAYQLMNSYHQFADHSQDRLSTVEDSDSKNYILLDELLEQYGDRLKETVKRIKDEIEESADRDKFISSDNQEDLTKLLLVGEKIVDDISKLPRDKVTDSVIQKKIDKTLRNVLQTNHFIIDNAQQIASEFNQENFANFSSLWAKQVDEIRPQLSTELVLGELEKIQQQIYQELQKELIKFEEILEYDSTRKEKKMPSTREITAYFTKNKENSNARMVADICIAKDPQMWADKDYFELVLFDKTRSRCVGTTMLKTIKEENKKYLLYCPNPAINLVSEVSAKKLYKKMTDLVINLAKDNNYTGVIVDKKLGKSTNRAGLFQSSLENSVLRVNASEIVIDLAAETKLSSYPYQHDLRAVYLKSE